MKKSIRLRIAGLIISALFLIVSVDSIPHIISWAPLALMSYFSVKNRFFRAWAVSSINKMFDGLDKE